MVIMKRKRTVELSMSNFLFIAQITVAVAQESTASSHQCSLCYSLLIFTYLEKKIKKEKTKRKKSMAAELQRSTSAINKLSVK